MREIQERRDEDLLAAYAAGDRGAAERLVEASYQAVYSLLRRLCGDTDLAADLTQETYRRAWDALAGFDGRARFSTWVCRIAYNTYLNHLRRPRRIVPIEPYHEAVAVDPAPAADEVVEQALLGDHLRRAVLGLPEDLRYTVIAIFWGDQPVAEVARQEGVTGVAIRKRLKRALAALAALLGAEAKRMPPAESRVLR